MSTKEQRGPTPGPQFEHDSTCCTFLGRSADGTHDLYVCTKQYAKTKDSTYLARYGSNGSDYTSCVDFILDTCAEEHPEAFKHCIEARELAKASL